MRHPFLHSSGQSPGELLAGALAVRRSARLSALSPVQGRAFVHRDVVGLVALDFILRFIRAGAVHMSFVSNILEVDLDDLAAHISGLRIPGHVITNYEPLFHEVLSVRVLVRDSQRAAFRRVP